ncbi:MAG: bifunctional precorrin-2 dehydrogenase/sirohydrochlorin ferrochelatase [Methanotrichaceae archaeon]|nr:bifunctional precorrin-2 dehydrogenase/sirohydrochlorin ferrochelatase [Methanotrichaceae archaeon]
MPLLLDMDVPKSGLKSGSGSSDHLMPLLLDMEGRKVVILGGGEVAERKARLFCHHAEVVVVSLEFTEGLMELAREGKLWIVAASLPEGAEGHLDGAFLAIPATDDKGLNSLLEERARSLGALVNRVDGRGEVVVPSILKKGEITIAISTGSPAFSRYLRRRLEAEMEGYAQMARLLGEIRPLLRGRIKSQAKRREILWQILADDEIWSLLGKSYGKAYIKARERISTDERDFIDAGDPPKG